MSVLKIELTLTSDSGGDTGSGSGGSKTGLGPRELPAVPETTDDLTVDPGAEVNPQNAADPGDTGGPKNPKTGLGPRKPKGEASS